MFKIKILPIIFVLLTALLVGCATVPMTGRHQLSLIPASELTAMSVDQYHQLLKESTLSQDRQQVEMIQRIGRDIAYAAEQFLSQNGMEDQIKLYQWEFNLIQDDSTVNAFCMPGGKVAFYTGILPLTQNDNGVAVVMGHEVAHAMANHGGERMSQVLLQQLGAVSLGVALSNKSEETQQWAMVAYGVGSQVGVLLPFSRTHESEADHIGLNLSAMAGYDPREAVPFWQRMSQMGGGRPPEFLSTHPNPEKRVAELERLMPEALQYYESSPRRH